MTTQQSRLTDQDIERFLRTRAADPDPSLWSDIMAAADATAQRTSLRARWMPRRRLVALLVAGLLMAAIAGGVGVGAGLLRPRPSTPPAQAGHAESFAREFDYAIAADAALRPGANSRQMYNFVGPDHGVVVFAVLNGSFTHDCREGSQGDHPSIRRGTPTEILEDLMAVGGVGIGAQSASTLDGRAAVAADIDPLRQRCETADVHLTPSLLGGDYVPLDRPSKLVLADIDGLIVGVQIWAERPEDLERWIPTAMQFVESIHFEPYPPPAP